MKTIVCLLGTALALFWLGTTDAMFPIVMSTNGCPDVPGQATLDTARYLGQWYEYERFPAIFEAGLECTGANYSLLSDTEIKVYNTGQLREIDGGATVVIKNSSIVGTATVPDPSKPAELAVTFYGPEQTVPNYFIQETDYDSYSVIYSCTDLFGINIQFAWILTRDRGVPPANLTQLEKNLAARGVDISPFFVVNQTACTF